MNIFRFSWIKFILSILLTIFAYYFSWMFVLIGPLGGYTLGGYVLLTISILSLAYLIIISIVGLYNKFKK